MLHEPNASRNVPAGGTDKAPVVEVVATNKAAVAMAAGRRAHHCHGAGALMITTPVDFVTGRRGRIVADGTRVMDVRHLTEIRADPATPNCTASLYSDSEFGFEDSRANLATVATAL